MFSTDYPYEDISLLPIGSRTPPSAKTRRIKGCSPMPSASCASWVKNQAGTGFCPLGLFGSSHPFHQKTARRRGD